MVKIWQILWLNSQIFLIKYRKLLPHKKNTSVYTCCWVGKHENGELILIHQSNHILTHQTVTEAVI